MEEIGQKLSQSDGLAISDNGNLYYGNIGGNSLNYWDVRESFNVDNQKTLFTDEETFQWQDTFAFDGAGNLLVVTNKLQLFPGNYNFDEVNFRIFSFDINGNSYMNAVYQESETQADTSASNFLPIFGFIVILTLLLI